MKKILALAFTGALMLACSTGAFAQDKTKAKTIKEKEVQETPAPQNGTATDGQDATKTKTKGTKVRTRAISIDEEGVSEGDKKDNGGGMQSNATEVKAVTRETKKVQVAPR